MKKLTRILLFVTIIAIPFYVVRFSVGPVPSTIVEVLIYLTFLSSLFSHLKGLRSSKMVWFGAFFVLAGLIATYFDPDKPRALGIWKAYFFDGYLLFLILLAVREKKEIIATALILSGLLAAVVSLGMFAFGAKTIDHRLLDLDRLSPNYLAMFLTPLLVLSFATLGQKLKLGKIYVFEAVAGLVMLVAVILTQSRGALVAISGVAVLSFIIVIFKKRVSVIVRSIVIVAFIILIISVYYLFRPDFTRHDRTASSSNIRYYIWSTSLEIARQNPVFGIGLSNYQDYFSNLTKDRVNYPEFISPQALTAHNLYLHLYIVSGILGLLSFIALVVSTKFWQFKNLALSVALIAILLYGLVDTPFFRNDLALVFWTIIALI